MYKYLILLLCFFVSPVYGALRVSWVPYPHPDVAGYVVFRADNNAFPLDFHQISPTNELVTDLFFMDEGAVGFKVFWYMVSAIDSNGNVIDEPTNPSPPKCVIHYCHGDANLSGVVDIADAVLIEQHVVGLVDICEKYQACRAADANLDGVVNIADSVLVKRFIVELDAQEAHCLVAQ
jgi:hypothetical protein